MNFVHLVLTKDDPLGVELHAQPSEDGIPTVSCFTKGGQAEFACQEAAMDPNLFRNAIILGTNGEKWTKDTSEALCRQLMDDNAFRPISIVFGMPQDAPIGNAINVHKRYNGNFIELVFCDKVLGIQLDNTDASALRVRGLVKDTGSRELCKECLLDPACFNGASMVRINGKTGDKDEIYQMLKDPGRPKSVLFELAPKDCPRRGAVNRRASLQMRNRAVFATESVRKLSVKTRENELLFNVNESIRQLIIEEEGGGEGSGDGSGADGNLREGLSELSNVSSSMRQLQISMAEMEELNAMNDQEARQRSASSVESDETPRSARAARARRVIQGLRQRRFGRRTESGRIIESETSNKSIDIDGDFESEEEKQKALDFLKKEAYEACLDAIRQHLDAFLSETPDVTYEEWVEELHPENAKPMSNVVGGKTIDHRFYVEESDHRKLWNDNLGDSRREYVPVREYVPPPKHGAPKTSKSFARSPPPRNNDHAKG
mmetsp:Transcript_10892/g.23059  ORF Transcript_10892/g.23059 Transcript_10892/m.23059 type:complete len:490 (+) Transcript_10892:211-1680(+)